MQQENLYKYIKAPELLSKIYLFLFLQKDNVIQSIKIKINGKI